MKKLLIPIVVIVMQLTSNAQEIPQVSQFTYDYLRTNPGSAGSLDMVSLTGIIRQQMVGFPGNPETFIFSAEAPFNLFSAQHGAGISVFRDAIGFNTDIDLHLTYAFRFNVGDGSLGIGVEGGFIDNSFIDGFQWVTSDGVSAGDDNYIPTLEPDGMTFTMGGGLFYRTEDIYFGVSGLHLNSPEVTSTNDNGGEVKYNLSRHYYVTAGYNMQLSNPAWELRPAVLLKSDGVSTDMDLNIICLYNKKIWGGVTYRTGEAIIGMVGIELFDGFKIGYSYDAQTSALINHNQGSHEFVLNYSFKIGVEKAPQKYKSIRFL